MAERLRRTPASVIVLLMVILAAPFAPIGVRSVAAEPSLDLTPFRGPCNTVVVALGTGFVPGLTVTFTAQLDGSADDRATVFAQGTVAADGRVSATANLASIVPGCTDPAAVAGQQYRLSARDASSGSLLAYALFLVTAPEGVPALKIDPASGSCPTDNPIITVTGTGFPAGSAVTLAVRAAASNAALFPGTIVGADGTFISTIRLIGCGPETPTNTTFLIFAYAGNSGNGDPLLQLATANYSTGSTCTGKVCFTETNQCIGGGFLARWQATGGLAVNGFPLSEEFKQKLEDGREYTVQYFERVRLEYHPNNTAPQDIQLGQFGRHILEGVTGAPTTAVSPRDGDVHFRETGHNLAPDFFTYWQANGGLNQFGYPLTEEFSQQLADGKTYTVQYFERARFERHPENQQPYVILLGQFGRQILAETRPQP